MVDQHDGTTVITSPDGTEHAVLSPSASERWISCPASVRLIAALPADATFNESPYAHEGTVAHALGELEASREFGKLPSDREYLKRYRKWEKWALGTGISTEQIEDMKEHIADYVDLLRERMALYPASVIMLECRMDTGVPSCWGTSDAVIVSPRHVEIVDLKYGQGVAVDAAGNPQLRLYALAALDTYGDLLGDAEVVRATVFQPRLHSVSTEELTAEELRAWRTEVVRPAAEAALDGTGGFGPSEKACRWCPLAGECRARLEYMTQLDFGQDPDLLSLEELADVLERLPDVRQWVAAVEATALRKAYSEGQHIPGWKVVLSGGQRYITDEDRAVDALTAAGLPVEQLYRVKLKGLGDLEDLLKSLPKVKPEGARRARHQRLEDVLPAEIIARTPGRESLVHENDPRPAVDPNTSAIQEFS